MASCKTVKTFFALCLHKMWSWLPCHLKNSGCSEDEATSVITLYWVTSWLTGTNLKCAVKLSYCIVEKCLNTTVLNLTVLKIKLSENLNSNRAFVFQVWRTWACWPSVNLLRKHSSNYNTISHFNMHAWHTDVLEINIKDENLLSVTKRCTLLDVSHLYGVSCLSISLWVLKSFSWSDKGFSKNKQSKNKQTNKCKRFPPTKINFVVDKIISQCNQLSIH